MSPSTAAPLPLTPQLTNAQRPTPAVHESITQQIGNTPLVRLNRVPQSLGIEATVYAKLEFFNAGGSVKDRIALRMIEEAEKKGRIKPGDTLIEPTSGNTGIGLALVGAVKGYKTIITLPEKMSSEKVAVLRALNATIIRTPTQAAHDSPESHIGVARRLQKEIPNAHILDQYGNPDNPCAHEYGTAPEIWAQVEAAAAKASSSSGGEGERMGKLRMVVAGAGTGGTITGLARGLRKAEGERMRDERVKIVAADPYGSILAMPKSLNEVHAETGYKVEGIGYDFVPDVLDQGAVDQWYKTDDREAFGFARRLIAEEGLLVGGSSGSAMAAMVRAVKEEKLGKGDVVVVILPDSIRSYLSKAKLSAILQDSSPSSPSANLSSRTQFADDDWLAANDLLPPTPPPTNPSSPSLQPAVPRRSDSLSSSKPDKSPFKDATIRTLRLKPVTTVLTTTPCAEAIETMRDKGFDQLPVLSSSSPGKKRLVGLVTLGNLLSWISQGRAAPSSPVKEVMFSFSKISEVVTDPRDIGRMVPQPPQSPVETTHKAAAQMKNGEGGVFESQTATAPKQKRQFVEITLDTPLASLNRFLEWNSAAVVTEREGEDEGTMKPVAVVTKVDLLTWLMRQGTVNGHS